MYWNEQLLQFVDIHQMYNLVSKYIYFMLWWFSNENTNNVQIEMISLLVRNSVVCNGIYINTAPSYKLQESIWYAMYVVTCVKLLNYAWKHEYCVVPITMFIWNSQYDSITLMCHSLNKTFYPLVVYMFHHIFSIHTKKIVNIFATTKKVIEKLFILIKGEFLPTNGIRKRTTY